VLSLAAGLDVRDVGHAVYVDVEVPAAAGVVLRLFVDVGRRRLGGASALVSNALSFVRSARILLRSSHAWGEHSPYATG
jgi:hypothetical protein